MSIGELVLSKKLILIAAALAGLAVGASFDKDNALSGSGNLLHAFALPFENLTSLELVTGQTKEGQLSLNPLGAYVEVFGALKEDYCGQIDSDRLTFEAVRGMLATTGDIYTRFLDPDAYQKIREENIGNFVGIGAYLNATPEGEPFIVRPMKGTPAEQAGIEAGDIIKKVGDVVVKGMLLDDVVKLIKGKIGTSVVLTIQRKEKDTEQPVTKVFTIIRQRVEHPVVEYEMKEDGIGWIALMTFNATTGAKLAAALRDLESEGKLKALILDLRSNPGGLFDAALDVSSRFLDSGTIVYVKERNKSELAFEVNKQLTWPHKYPLVVLVNGASASASEIVAGALQQNHAATLVGEKTFGKGLVQTIYRLPFGDKDTAVAITTAIYLTPDKEDINRKGIIPDVEVDITADDIQKQRDPQLEKAIEILKAKIGHRTASALIDAAVC
jgi:carboxyl-terminal processing protease